MMKTIFRDTNPAALTLLAAGSVLLASTAAYAQRDPAYQAAREAGVVGEKTDGYLGFVSSPTPEVEALVKDINIKRKQAYLEKAATTNSTVEQFAFTTACNLILKTLPGERYQAPDGSWQTRGAGAPQRDARCP
jgi:uncharacterized protein YdbL (DUF1318 family)